MANHPLEDKLSQPYAYRHYYPYQQPYVQSPAPQRYSSPYWQTPAGPAPQATGQQPIFRVSLMKHTGLAVAWLNQTYTVTGTFAQCESAIRQAQQHNLAAGWWSPMSLLMWNWVALLSNLGARKSLRIQAARAWANYAPTALQASVST